jgi:hypothetical protein
VQDAQDLGQSRHQAGSIYSSVRTVSSRKLLKMRGFDARM